jgi:hypothetical protein
LDAQTKRYLGQDWGDDQQEPQEFEAIRSQTNKVLTVHQQRRQQSKQLGNLGRQALIVKRRRQSGELP